MSHTAELIAVGTELLLGNICNTDAQMISQALSQLGINPYFAGEYDTAVRNYPAKKTMRIISLLKEYDQRSKSNTRGEASDGDLLKELTAKILA